MKPATFAEEVTQMIKDCENRQEHMTEWEQKFIDSLDNQLGNGKSLSPKQYAVLERIWEKVSNKGTDRA